jgi:hypothetical protein
MAWDIKNLNNISQLYDKEWVRSKVSCYIYMHRHVAISKIEYNAYN